MFWSFPDREWWLLRGEIARRRHAAWLTRALRSPKPLPRIPTRPVSAGGFDPVLATAAGARWAEAWWRATLENPDLDLEQ